MLAMVLAWGYVYLMRHVLTIPGPPHGKGRPRVTRRGHVFTPKKTREWQDNAVKALQAQWSDDTLSKPLRVDVLGIKQRPKRLQRRKDPPGLIWRTAKPDRDNVDKAALDALVKAGIIKDDIYVVCGQATSWYAEKEGSPRTVIILSDAPAEDEILLELGIDPEQ